MFFCRFAFPRLKAATRLAAKEVIVGHDGHVSHAVGRLPAGEGNLDLAQLAMESLGLCGSGCRYAAGSQGEGLCR
jgi:hypothetical protein